MLIDFSVENFKSFRDKQTFSMEAAPYLRNKSNVFKPALKGEKPPSLLKIAAIYGPNASGKSNLVSALNLINKLLNSDRDHSSSILPVSPFRFDKELSNQPSRFEINFISEAIKYRFEISLTSERITYESLTQYYSGKPVPLYVRSFINGAEEYSIKGPLEGDDILHNAWINLTSPKQVFLSQAVTNSNENLKQLRIPFDWLNTNLRSNPESLSDFVDIMQIMNNELPDINLSNGLADFLSELDIPIAKIDFNNTSRLDDIRALSKLPDDDGKNSIREVFNRDKVIYIHKTDLGEASFSFNEESEGTKNLSGFNLMWTILTNSSDFNSMVFDELDSSLHPKIIEQLVVKLLNSKIHTQLIFTTHNTHLMDSKLLRRDQFWIAERDNNGATRLASIYDYQGRESEDIEKRYFEGRYRGLPNTFNI